MIEYMILTSNEDLAVACHRLIDVRASGIQMMSRNRLKQQVNQHFVAKQKYCVVQHDFHIA